jgi:sulfur carrier protein
MSKNNAVVTIQLNGEPYAIEENEPLVTLLEKLGMRTGRVAVEINQAVVPKADYARTTLRSGDQVEIINFVGGG